eukprot:5522220-Lingulodinium_polyedra.AAC.1
MDRRAGLIQRRIAAATVRCVALPAEPRCVRAPASPRARRAVRWRRAFAGGHGHLLAWHRGGLWRRGPRRVPLRG